MGLDDKDDKKQIYSWTLYDWANSAFATTVLAGFFPLFFKSYWAIDDPTSSTYYLGLANSIASLIVALLAPYLGSMADKMSGKKKFLTFFAFLGILNVLALGLVGQGLWQFAIFFFVIGTVGFSGANIFYDSLLPNVASKEKIDYVSSLGFSLGYIGGGVLFLINVIMYLMMEDGVLAIKLSFVSVGIWWAVFSIPLILFVKEEQDDTSLSFSKAIKEGYVELRETFQDIKKLKYVGLFLLGYWFYIDGVDTIIRMAVDYGITLGFDDTALIIALLITQFVAFPGTYFFHMFSAKIGHKNGILVAIGAYILITILGYFMTKQIHFFLLAILIGLFQGGIQALSRSLYSRMVPKNKEAEFYGFFNMLGKFAAVIGPALMGIVTDRTGDIRKGLLSIILLFVIGGILLFFVDIEKGEEMAKDFGAPDIDEAIQDNLDSLDKSYDEWTDNEKTGEGKKT